MKPIARVQLCKHLSDVFPTGNGWKQGDALSPLVIYFALDSAIRTVHINQDGFKLSDTHQVLVYADDVNPLNTELNPIYYLLALLELTIFSTLAG